MATYHDELSGTGKYQTGLWREFWRESMSDQTALARQELSHENFGIRCYQGPLIR